jgi:hypothetical protein
MSAPRCADCRFYSGHTYCRRHPPVVMLAGSTRSFWPTVEHDDWCGDFAPAKPEHVQLTGRVLSQTTIEPTAEMLARIIEGTKEPKA